MYFTRDDATYWYEIEGKGAPVLLLHGFTGSTTTWKTFISEWKDQFQMIAVDLPGHGKTVTPSPRTMETCCKDLQALLHYLQLSEVHMIGYSMGGRTALTFAMLFPDQVASLTLESASPGLSSEAERVRRRENDEKLAQRIEQYGIERFVDFWENIPLFATQKQLSNKVLQVIRRERLSQSERGLAQSLRSMGTGIQPSWWGQLKQFARPVLLLAGAEDKKFTRINLEMKKRIAASQLNIVENIGHAIHVEEPEIFGKIVTEFILKENR